MKPVRLTSAANSDVARLGAFLATKNERAALGATDALLAAVQSLRHFPDRGKSVGNGRRELVVAFGKDGYVMRYRAGREAVVVTRIFHGRERR